jgi:riboflavin kinase/FMN adenylyltransferase
MLTWPAMKLTAQIVHGAGRGKVLGFPTINLLLEKPQFLEELPEGVYAVRVELGEEHLMGAMNHGSRPTFSDNVPQMEIFLLDFEGELYGREVQVEIVQKIRAIQKFESTEALIEQIEKDVKEVRRVLSVG